MERLGKDPILVRLAVKGEVHEAEVSITTALIETQGPVVVNPGREPHDSSPCRSGEVLCFGE
jgi:hypothetical protein